MKLSIQARAKINWTLDVVGTLPNGYHDLDMLMQSVTLCDQLTIEDAPECTLSVRMQGGYVPADGSNLVLRAARALQEATGETRGARMTLCKYIPVAAGMGGGSSDAAAALKGLNVLWNLGLTDERLEEIGLTIGADDDITKPFNPLEVVARVKTQLRRAGRYNQSAAAPEDAAEYDIRGLIINRESHKCALYGRELALTPIEFSILWYLCSRQGRIVPSEELFEAVWKEKYLQNSNNTVMAHIARLREKMNEPPRNPKFIKTVWGVGYEIE